MLWRTRGARRRRPARTPRRRRHGVRARGRDEIGDGGRRDRQVGAEVGGAGIARGDEQGRVREVALQRPTQRVLAAAPADDQDLHFFLNASENAWAARLALSTTSSTTAFA